MRPHETMHKILVADPIVQEGIEILSQAGEVQQSPGLSEAELRAIIGDFAALVVRSGTRVTRAVIEAGRNLRVIARAGVGVDNIDVAAATRRGVLVVNSPSGNTTAAAEHTIGLLLAAARMIPQGDAALKAGRWERSSFMGRQVSGKTLGIIGLGKVGSEVARRARALGMNVLVYDPYVPRTQADSLGAEVRDLDSLLAEADFVTIHAALTEQTRHLLGARELGLMKPDAILVNCARGGLVDEAALLKCLRNGRLKAAALDVFEDEPTPNPELVRLPNVIATPHLGASTREAQVQVAVDAARQVVDVLAGRPPRWPVNAPALPEEGAAAVAPFVPLARALGLLQHAVWPTAIQRTELRCSADLAPAYLGTLNRYFLVALLERTTDEPINYVNVSAVAEERGIQVAEATLGTERGYSRVLEAVVTGAEGSHVVTGALVREGQPRIINLDGYSIDLVPDGTVLLIWNSRPEQPGFVGKFGTLTGEAGVNIRGIQVAAEQIGGVGLMVANVATPVTDTLAEQIRALPGVQRLLVVNFS